MKNKETWQLQEAKAQLSDLIQKCSTQGPQAISVHGNPKAIVLSIKDYQKLTQAKPSFIQFMQSSPWQGLDLDITRDQSLPRKTKL